MRHGVSPATLGVYFLKPTVQALRRRPAEPRLDEAVIRVATAHQQGAILVSNGKFLALYIRHYGHESIDSEHFNRSRR